MVTGRVAAFHEHRGDGVIIAAGGESLYFHCVDIADGTRAIRVGTRVNAQRIVGHCGADEVAAVTPLAPREPGHDEAPA